VLQGCFEIGKIKPGPQDVRFLESRLLWFDPDYTFKSVIMISVDRPILDQIPNKVKKP
jgi:hypothetical protein